MRKRTSHPLIVARDAVRSRERSQASNPNRGKRNAARMAQASTPREESPVVIVRAGKDRSATHFRGQYVRPEQRDRIIAAATAWYRQDGALRAQGV